MAIDLSGYTFAASFEGFNPETNEWQQAQIPMGDGQPGLEAASTFADSIREANPEPDPNDPDAPPVTVRDVRVEYAPIIEWTRWIDSDD